MEHVSCLTWWVNAFLTSFKSLLSDISQLFSSGCFGRVCVNVSALYPLPSELRMLPAQVGESTSSCAFQSLLWKQSLFSFSISLFPVLPSYKLAGSFASRRGGWEVKAYL